MTAMDCDCNLASRNSQFPLARGDAAWPAEDAELGLPTCQALFAAVAHDLKNAVAGLVLWCDMLEVLRPRLATGGDNQATALFRSVLEQINTLVYRSLHVVDDLLDISRVEAGHMLPLAVARVELVSLVEEVVRSRPEGATTGRIRLEAVDSEVWGLCDADRLARVVENLVSNAIKYSPRNEPIVVRIDEQAIEGQTHAVLAVEDRGIGISAEDLPHVFDVFHRGQNVDPSTPGHGLGLWVSRAIVARHGGTLTLDSREGQGTTVTVRLPLSAAAAEPLLDSSRRLDLVLGAG